MWTWLQLYRSVIYILISLYLTILNTDWLWLSNLLRSRCQKKNNGKAYGKLHTQWTQFIYSWIMHPVHALNEMVNCQFKSLHEVEDWEKTKYQCKWKTYKGKSTRETKKKSQETPNWAILNYITNWKIQSLTSPINLICFLLHILGRNQLYKRRSLKTWYAFAFKEMCYFGSNVSSLFIQCEGYAFLLAFFLKALSV